MRELAARARARRRARGRRSGPSAIATAIARFSSTTGPGRTRSELRRSGARSRASRCPRRAARARARRRSPPGARRGRAARARSAAAASARPSVDLRAIPARAVLVLEQHELAVRRRARLAARVVEQHQREEAARLGRAGQQLGEQAPEADRLAREVGAHERVALRRRVALVEDEVDDRHHRVEPLGQQLGRRHLVGDAGLGDLALRAHQPLREGRRSRPGRRARSRRSRGRRACAARAPPAPRARARDGSR